MEYVIWVRTANGKITKGLGCENYGMAFVAEPFLEAIPQATIMMGLAVADRSGCHSKSLAGAESTLFTARFSYSHVCSR